MRATWVWIGALGALLRPEPAAAGAFYMSDIGARGNARGGAFVAAPDSLLAIHYNPAGLSYLKGLHFEGSLALNFFNLTFQRTCPCTDPASVGDAARAAEFDRDLEAQFTGRPTESNRPQPVPFLSIGYGFPALDLTVAFAVWGPNSGRHGYELLPSVGSTPEQGEFFQMRAAQTPHRYTALDVDTLEANYALGVGLQPVAGLRVGAVVMLYQNGTDQPLHLWANSGTFATAPEDTTFDIPIRFKFFRPFALNWAIGANYEVIPGLVVGSSFRGKRSIRSDGTLDISLTPAFKDLGAEVSGNEIELEINTAPLWRLGVQYELPKVFKAEAAMVAEFWSVYERVVIRSKNVSFKLGASEPVLLPKIIQRKDWTNVVSFRLGGEIDLLEPWVGFRAGYFYEPSAIPAENLDPQRVDLDKHGFSIGAATTQFGFTLELSAMLVALADAEVRNSRARQTAPLPPEIGGEPRLVTATGNGNYSATFFIVSASLGFALDPLLSFSATGDPRPDRVDAATIQP